MIRSVRIRLLPNNKQRTKLFQFAGASRFAYNWALDKQMENFREGRKLQSDYDLRKEFTVLRNSEEYLWLLGISNNVTKQAIKDLCIAYKNFFQELLPQAEAERVCQIFTQEAGTFCSHRQESDRL